MEKIYANSYDHDVKSQVLYVKDSALYIDEECTVGASMDIVFDLFVKCMMVVCADGVYHAPVACTKGDCEAQTHATVTVGEATYSSVDEFEG